MGSFGGHALPGAIFFLFGAWWAVQVMRRYFQCRQTGKPFRSTATFPCSFCPAQRMREFPVEAVVKMFLCLAGIAVEFIAGINHDTHKFDDVGNGQHITMYAFFFLSGVLDLLTYRGLAPEGADYFGMVTALLMEGGLFQFHLYGRTKLDVLVHTLLLYVIALSALVMAVEHFKRHMAVLPMLRALLTLVQGTWFWAVGIILYNPTPGAVPWEQDDHHALMLAVICFSWHVAVDMLLVFVVGGVAACCYRGSRNVRYSGLESVPLKCVDEEEEVEEGKASAETDLERREGQGQGQP